MGWLGVVAGRILDELGVDWCWYDTDSPVQSWRASTGIVYPGGDEMDRSNYDRWIAELAEGRWIDDAVEPVEFWFAHLNPPHGGKYSLSADLGSIRRGSLPAVMVNVPEVVARHRELWADRRVEPRQPDVIAHGFRGRIVRWVWGYSVKVRLEFSDELRNASESGRLSLYGRDGRFKIVYAHLGAGSDYWRVGSSLISQKVPKELDAGKHFDSCRASFEKLFGDHAQIVEQLEEPVHGWRPKRSDEDDDRCIVDPTGVIHFPSVAYSGVRWTPSIADSFREVIPR
jgi:hypothetical protein